MPGSAVELGFLGSVMFAEIPRHENEHQSMATSSFGEKFDIKVHVSDCLGIYSNQYIDVTASKILASLPTPLPSPVSLFASFLPKVWALWECLVLSEPLLIFAPSPAQTSSIIWWLRDFFRPVRASVCNLINSTKVLLSRYLSQVTFGPISTSTIWIMLN